MGLTVHTKVEGLPAAQEQALRSLAATIHAALEHLAQEQQIPDVEVTVVVAGDFASEVGTILRQQGDGSDAQFSTERIGGVVVGKCIALNDDFSKQVVVIDGMGWINPDPAAQAQSIASLVHELAHVVIDRARHASGALDGVPATPYNGVDMAREIARTAATEFRADLIANAVLRVLASTSDGDGVTRPLTIYDLCGDSHCDELRRTLDAVVHPGWPDTVQRYREHHMTLPQLWEDIASSTGGVFNLLAHGEAHADAGSASSPLETLRAHRGVELYLGPAWQALEDTITAEAGILPALSATRAYEQHIAEESGRAILDMWARLGLTVEVDLRDGRFALWVGEPQR
jgi:hypothetical protein